MAISRPSSEYNSTDLRSSVPGDLNNNHAVYSMCIYDNYVNIYASYALTAINNMTRRTGIYIHFTLLA